MKKMSNRITSSITKLANNLGDPNTEDKPIIFFHDPSKQKNTQKSTQLKK